MIDKKEANMPIDKIYESWEYDTTMYVDTKKGVFAPYFCPTTSNFKIGDEIVGGVCNLNDKDGFIENGKTFQENIDNGVYKERLTEKNT
jgi:hypothetical protein